MTRKNRTINDMVISFVGDPTLTMEDLFRLLKPVRNTTIPGNIFLDASLFTVPSYSPNLMIDDLGTYSARPVSSININENLIIVTAKPGKMGKSAVLSNDSGYPIKSTVTTTEKPSAINLVMHNNCIQVSGNIYYAENSLELKISPIDFDRYVLYKIRKVMKSIKLKGKVVIVHEQSQLPKKLVVINTIKSETLGNIIPLALKKSDNLVFDSLYLKIITSRSSGGIKNWDDGDDIIKRLLHECFNVDMTGAKFVDGSGLSRYNRIQPRKLFTILRYGYSNKEFVAALPSPGESGSTLTKRTDLLPSIKAKTGNMTGISCLCGYDANVHPKAFVVIANSFAPPSKEIFSVIDNFVNRCLGK